jgi:hypothetical protein
VLRRADLDRALGGVLLAVVEERRASRKDLDERERADPARPVADDSDRHLEALDRALD